LCRRCGRAAGRYTPRPPAQRVYLTDRHERALRRLLEAVAAERTRLAAAARPVVTGREVTVGRRAYVVVWDGTK
jgi:hypothetical protein